MEMITICLPKDEAVTLIKCLKIAKARKRLEANHHLKKGEVHNSNLKFSIVQKINQLSEYVEYLTK